MTTSKKFRFVSPGIFISEIDKSQIPAIPAEIGPVVIGRAERGPTMVPVTVNSYLEFVDKFGEPTRGVAGDDTWRSGKSSSPLYAAYAAKAWLKNSNPLTFVRLAGQQSPNVSPSAGERAKAGWKLDNTATASLANNGGAYGLFVVPSGSNLTSLTGTLAAVWYLNSGGIKLVGNRPNNVLSSNGAGELIKSINSNYEFRAQIVDSSGATKLDTSFNFSRDSSKYIRKVFNTNPTLVNSNITTSDSLSNYWLGETFATFLTENVSQVSGNMAFIAPLKSISPDIDAGNFSGKQNETAKSGWIISQHLSSVTSSFVAEQMPKLFRFAVTETAGGEWEQKNIKVSIRDIKPSTNNFNKFGTFTVEIRRADDTDSNPTVLEVFTGCNLNPNSADFVGNKIGDEYLEWDDTTKRYIKYGNYPNNSSYIRVELSELLEQSGIPEESLPFGFFGPPVFDDVVLVSGSDIPASSMIRGTDLMPFAPTTVSSSIGVTGLPTGSEMLIKFPTMKLRVSSSTAGTLVASDAYYGIVSTTDSRFDEDYLDLVRAKPLGVNSHAPQSGVTKASWIFTLDDVISLPNTNGLSVWQSGSRAASPGTSISAIAATGSGDLEGYKATLAYGADRFTVPLFGGTDGLNVKEKDPFRNTLLNESDFEDDNAMLYSLKKAIDTVKDPDVLDMNLLVAPGVTNTVVTKHMIDTAESRGDALAIIDLPGGYVPAHENTSSEKDRRGSVSATVSGLKSRSINSSYTCAYYPWVKVQDDGTGVPLWMPPSVVAFGTMASSQESTEVWFAPAGFNRGGLTSGLSGLSVIDVREKLSSKDRDKLYENNINPIASFPNEGVVIFGQKTLQVTQSALDRINVRRLLIYLKKEVSRISTRVLFDQNLKVTWDRFKGEVDPFLSSVKSRFGLSDYKVILDETTTTPDLVDRNIMYAKIYLKPARAIEFIALDFVITRSGASFDD
jgi:hypothetical protein